MMRAFIFIAFSLLIACGGPVERTTSAGGPPQQPGLVYLKADNSPGVLSVELRPFTNSGVVETLGMVIVDRGQTSPRAGRQVVVTDAASFAGARQAAATGTNASGLIAAAMQVARATFCRTGPVTQTGVRPNPIGRGVEVRFACNAPSPYVSAKADALTNTGPTAAQLQAAVVGKTTLAVSLQHGTQVEYIAADGRAYLWYPGNTRVNTGTWRVQKSPRPRAEWTEICFFYGSNSYNPVTRTRGIESCTPAATFLAQTTDQRSGDVFNLSSGAIPAVLPAKTSYSFAQLLRL